MKRKIIAIIVLGLILLASLLACGYFGVKTIRRTQLRRAGMTAYEKKDYALAERLLRQYVQNDPNAEAEYVALANIYHEFGDIGMEARMWQRASALNPLSDDYRAKMLNAATDSASYYLLHSALGRRVQQGEQLDDRELLLYLLSCYRADHLKDADAARKQYHLDSETEPELFLKSELGSLVQYLVKVQQGRSSGALFLDRLNELAQSVDPLVKYEALYSILLQKSFSADDGAAADDTEIESFIRKLVEINYYAGTPTLADFYYSRSRFADVIAVSEPYLKKIDDLNMALLYLESCVYEDRLEPLKTMVEKLYKRPGNMPLLAEYGDILIAYLENDVDKLAAIIRKSGVFVNSPLSRFMRLRVAMESKSFSEIRTVAQEFFSYPPFHDLHNRAMLICLDYLSEEMQKPENQKDPSQMAELAKILSARLQGNQLLTEIIVADQYKKGLAKEADLMAALQQFPDDPLLQRVTAEYLVLNGKAAQAMSILEPILSTTEEEDEDSGIRFLHMLALDQLERYDEAEVVFRSLVEQSEFDLDLLAQYFLFCRNNDRKDDLLSMANKLDTVKDGNLEHFGKIFRAMAFLLEDDDAKTEEALKMLAAMPNDNPAFTFYAANMLSEHDRLDDAEAKYKAILKTYGDPSLILVNLSEIYKEKGETEKALEIAKEAYNVEKKSILPAFVYANRLSEAGRYEEAVAVLNFPRRAVNYREDVVELWTECMKKTIEKNIADRKYTQAEENCKHLLVIVPGDEFGQAKLEEVRKLMRPKNGQKKEEDETEAETEPAAS